MKRQAILVLASIYLSACTTMTTVPYSSAAPQAGVNVGDQVAVVSRDGETHRFAITKVSADGICGEARCIAAGDVSTVAKEEISVWRTALLVVAIVATAGAAAAARFPGLPGAPVFP